MPMEFDINIGILCAQKFRDMESGRIYTKHHMHGFQGDDHTTVIKVAVQFFYNWIFEIINICVGNVWK